MHGTPVCRTLLYACGILVVITSLAFAAQDPPRNIAKLPTPEAAAPTSQALAPDTPSAPPTPTDKTQVAQLPGDSGPPLTAADLIRQAYDCMFYKDSAGERAFLEQAVAAEPGSKDAGRALALLAETYASADPAQSAALFSEVAAQYTDAEVLAFAELVEAMGVATRAEEWEQVEELLADAAARWKGTPTGAWAALQLGDHYRWNVEDWEAAIVTFQAILKEYGAGPVAEEAAVSLAECVNWSETGHVGDAIELYRGALAMTQNTGFRIRALVGLGHCYQQMSDWTACWDTLSLVVNGYPSHPAAALAAIIRARAAEQLGYWQATVDDARFYLASTNQQPLWRTYANYVLAQDAFRAERYDEAESQFAFVCDLAEKPQGIEFRGKARAGIAACREMRGDLRGALGAYLEAADYAVYQSDKAVYLYEAAGLAQSLGDSAVVQGIADRMASELPGSHLTTRLLGHEVLPAPEI